MSAQHTLLQPASLGQPIGLYSHGALVPRAAALLFVAGQLSVDTAGTTVGAGDLERQMRQVFANVNAVLEEAHMTFSNVLKFTTYLVDADDVEGFYEVRARLFSTLFGGQHYPPNTLLVVQRLVRPEFLIEVEAVAGDFSA